MSVLVSLVSLTNLVDLDLSGNGALDFDALSQWLNRSSVAFLDLFSHSLWNDPTKLISLMETAKKLKHLRLVSTSNRMCSCCLISFSLIIDYLGVQIFLMIHTATPKNKRLKWLSTVPGTPNSPLWRSKPCLTTM